MNINTFTKMKKPKYTAYNEKTKKIVKARNYIIDIQAEMILNNLTEKEWESRHWALLEIRWAKQDVALKKKNGINRYKSEALKFRNILFV